MVNVHVIDYVFVWKTSDLHATTKVAATVDYYIQHNTTHKRDDDDDGDDNVQ